MEEYIAVDLETTGLNAKRDKIIEIGAVYMKNGQAKATFSELVYPGCRLPEPICALTGIRDEMLCGKRTIAEVLPDFLDFAGNLPLLGHNLQFDYSFLKQACVNGKYPFERVGADTLQLCRKYLSFLERRDLTSVCGWLQIKRTQCHRAYEDAWAAAEVYERLKELADVDAADFAAKPLDYQAKKTSPATKMQKEYLKELAGYHKIELQADLDLMSKNEASRRIDEILRDYGRLPAKKRRTGGYDETQ